MRTLENCNPFVTFIYFGFVTLVGMFIPFPPLLAVSLICAMVCFAVTPGDNKKSFFIFAWVLFLVLVIINPIISHKGSTVLLVINDRPVTLESIYFGLNSAVMVVSALFWFKCLTFIMTGDKLIYITSFLSKDLSLVLSMSLRFVPLFNRQRRRVRDTQRAMGLFNEDSITGDILASVRIFSIIITWALENGITTADSMEARGFSVGRRTCYRIERFTLRDLCMLLIFTALFGVVIVNRLTGGADNAFYPDTYITFAGGDAIAAAAFLLLGLMPVILKAEVSLKWRYLQRRV